MNWDLGVLACKDGLLRSYYREAAPRGSKAPFMS